MDKKEVEQQKIATAKKKHADSVKYMYFSRYLMIRYIVTIFFFTNLMWLIISASYGAKLGIISAVIMTIYSAIACLEQLSKMHNRKKDIPITRIYFYVQIIVNVVLAIILFTPISKTILPFVINHDIQYFMVGLLLVGMILAILCEVRIRQIRKDQDRYYKVIQTFKKYQQ